MKLVSYIYDSKQSLGHYVDSNTIIDITSELNFTNILDVW